MNVAASTYDLRLPAPVPRADKPAPTNSFVTRLVRSLAWTFDLDAVERELALHLLFGRPVGAIARQLGICATRAQRLCHSLFKTTGTDGREKLFELALRLTTMRELNGLITSGGQPNNWSSAETVPARTIQARS